MMGLRGAGFAWGRDWGYACCSLTITRIRRHADKEHKDQDQKIQRQTNLCMMEEFSARKCVCAYSCVYQCAYAHERRRYRPACVSILQCCHIFLQNRDPAIAMVYDPFLCLFLLHLPVRYRYCTVFRYSILMQLYSSFREIQYIITYTYTHASARSVVHPYVISSSNSMSTAAPHHFCLFVCGWFYEHDFPVARHCQE